MSLKEKKKCLRPNANMDHSGKVLLRSFVVPSPIRPLGLPVSQIVRFHRKLATRQVLPAQGLMRQLHFLNLFVPCLIGFSPLPDTISEKHDFSSVKFTVWILLAEVTRKNVFLRNTKYFAPQKVCWVHLYYWNVYVSRFDHSNISLLLKTYHISSADWYIFSI